VAKPAADAANAALLGVQIRTAMVTGDHVRTAVSVAHQCNILPEGRPVLLMDAAPAGQPVDACPVALSVLYPDGSVNASVTRAAVLPQVRPGTCLEGVHCLSPAFCCIYTSSRRVAASRSLYVSHPANICRSMAAWHAFTVLSLCSDADALLPGHDG
jgi:magnesium-transporting ATPase (P-type)